MYMYICLHPVRYNSNHKHVGAISCLLETKEKMKQFTYSVHVRGCLYNTGGTFAPERVHSGSLSWLYICLHDTTTKCHAGASHPGVSSPQFLYGGENFTPVRNLTTVSCKGETTIRFGVKSVHF